MPGTWAENLEERALTPQLEEIVQIDPGDFGQPGPEYGQKPKMTNIEARVLLGNDPGDKCAIEPAALGTTFGINRAFVPSFGQPSLLKAAARIATTMTTPMNPVFVATQHKTGAAKPFPSESGGGGGGGPAGGGPGGLAGSGPGVLRLDGPFGPQWFSRVEVATRLWLRRSRAKSFSADLEGNQSNHSRFVARESNCKQSQA